MARGSDDRGQALQVGAVLLFGILIVVFAVWQTFIIPEQNEEVEFVHNQEVQSEMVELRSEVISTAEGTAPSAGTVELGTQFPTRLLFVNPPPASGQLSTETFDDGQLYVQGANATDPEERAFWNGSTRSYNTSSVVYVPDYSEFGGAPRTIYDNTVAYNVFEGEGSIALSGQSFVERDGTISLVVVQGEFDERGVGTATPDILPVSTQTRTVEVEPDGGLTLSVPTRLDATEWELGVFDEFENVPVADVTANGSERVDIELESGRRYTLELALVGFGTGTDEPEPAYLTTVEESGAVQPGERGTVTVELRDRFNGPVGGTNLTVLDPANATLLEDGSAVGGNRTIRTDVDGRATVDFEVDANASGDLDLSVIRSQQNISFETTVPVAPPETAFTLEWDSSSNFVCDFDATPPTCDPDGNSTGTLTANATSVDGVPEGEVQFALGDADAADLNTTNATIDANGQVTVELENVDSDPDTTVTVFGGGASAAVRLESS